MEELTEFEKGRISVLQDFHDVCKADVFMGFTEIEWKAIQRFFAFNEAITGVTKYLN